MRKGNWHRSVVLQFGAAAAAVAIIAAPACGGDSGATTNTPDASFDAASLDSSATPDATTCATGKTACGGACVDLQGAHDNCGTCGMACGDGQVCSMGKCGLTCSGGTTNCSGSCVDTKLDPANCGMCAMACGTGRACAAGKCVSTCPSGQTNCGPDGGATVCVDTMTSNQSCGSCGNACNPGQVCSGGTCALSCQAGLVNCGGTCIDPRVSQQHCGATAGCGADAGSAGTACAAGFVCSAGTCSLSCQSGLINCNGTCVDPSSNHTYCGATLGCGGDGGSAGATCANNEACFNGTCTGVAQIPSANLIFWLKADAITGLADGTGVATWPDSSGNSRNATQATVGSQPMYKTNILNGLPVVRFNPASSFMTTPLFQLFTTGSSPLTIFTVFRANTVNNQRFLLQQPENNCNNNLELGYDTGTQVPAANFGVHAGCSIAAVTSTAITAGTWYVAVTEIATSGAPPGNVTFRENGVAQTTTQNAGGWVASGNYGTTSRKLVIGGRDDNNNNGYNSFHDGDIAEIVIYAVVDTTVRGQVETYLRTKWGI